VEGTRVTLQATTTRVSTKAAQPAKNTVCTGSPLESGEQFGSFGIRHRDDVRTSAMFASENQEPAAARLEHRPVARVDGDRLDQAFGA
jgi:hypothetical protein